MNHRDAEDAEEATIRRCVRSEHREQSASTGNPIMAWSKTLRALCRLCVLSGSNYLYYSYMIFSLKKPV